MKHTVRVAVDVTGTDRGTPAVVAGVLTALQLLPGRFSVHLCGRQGEIEKQLDASNDSSLRSHITVVDCPQGVTPEDNPATVWKRKTGSPTIRCISLQAEGAVDASICAGDTALLMPAAHFLLGCRDNVSRPALAAILPAVEREQTLLLDVGANLNCRSEHLMHFARLGGEYVSRFYGISQPKIALLNVGTEHKKGPAFLGEVRNRLQREHPGFCGYVEGSHVLSGKADVVVCDGFTGNVLLKACESFYLLAEAILSDDQNLLGAVRSKMTVLNAENYGAAPLLGVKGIVFKAHGNSSSRAITNAILKTVHAVCRQREPFLNAKGLHTTHAV